MQFKSSEGSLWKIWGIRLVILLLYLIALPFVIVFWFPVVTTMYTWNRLNDKSLTIRVIVKILLFIGSLVLDVIVVPLSLIALPFIIFFLIYNECVERHRLRKEYKRNLQLKFGVLKDHIMLM